MTAVAVDFRLCRTRTKPDITPSRSVCRRLFGPVDHDLTRSDHQRELHEMAEEQNLRYNFDFARETPLPGNLCWQKHVAPKEGSSDCAQDTCQGSVRSAQCCSSEISSSNAGSRTETVDTTNIVCNRRDVKRKRSLTGKMTDYLRQKKLRCESSTEEKASRTSSRSTWKAKTSRQAKLDSFVTKQPFVGDQS